MGPGPRFIQAGATRAEADAMDLPALRYSPGERWRYRFSGRPDAFLVQRDAVVLRIGPSASPTLLKPGPTTRNARPRE